MAKIGGTALTIRDMRTPLIDAPVTGSIIGAFYAVYNTLRFGFLESVYAAALTDELHRRGHRVAREVAVPVYFRGQKIATQRLDLLVDGRVVVEVKSGEVLHQSAHRQLLSYLKSTEIEVGLLLHFGPEPRFYRAVTTKSPRERIDPAPSA
jgi:GxxExxY protein